MSEWSEYTLGDFANVNPKESLPKGSIKKKFPMDALGELRRDLVYSETDEYKGGTKFRNGDTLLARITPCLQNGKTAFVDVLDEDEIAFGSTEFIVLREREEVSAALFLYYLAISPRFRRIAIKSMTGSTGRQRVQNDVLINHLFDLPPLPEQKAIAHILGKLDDKIELNRKMNETLEGMAQALFKSWFVDFDPVLDNALAAGNPIPEALQAKAERRKTVPDHSKLITQSPKLATQFPNRFEFNETLNKWIPEGWEVESFSEIVDLIGGGTPKTSIDEYWNGDIPWFSVVDAPNGSDVFVIDTEKKVTELGVDNSSTKILPEWTTIISARGTIGKCALVGVPMAMNQSCYGVRSKSPKQDIYTYLLLRKSVIDLKSKSHGSVFNTITRDTFKAIQIVQPSGAFIQTKFDKIVSGFFLKIKSNLFKIETLTILRDTLLPQLISGKVRVPEKFVREFGG